MATSGSYDIGLDAIDIIDEAYERVGGQVSTGNEYTSARRSLDLLFRDFENRGTPLYRIEEFTTTVVDGTQNYTLDSAILDIVNLVVQFTDGGTTTEIVALPIARGEYVNLPDKAFAGRPAHYYVDKQQLTTSKLYVWPTGDTNKTETLRYWAIIRHEKVGALTNTLSVRDSFLPALISGLSYFLSLKRPELDNEYRTLLKVQYEQDMSLAFEADRQLVPTRIVPRVGW